MRLIPSDFSSLTQTIVSLLAAHPERPVLIALDLSLIHI